MISIIWCEKSLCIACISKYFKYLYVMVRSIGVIESYKPCRHFLWFLQTFQRMEHPIVWLDSTGKWNLVKLNKILLEYPHEIMVDYNEIPGIQPMELFACHLNHICCPLTEMVCFHRSSRAKFAP